MKELPGLSRSIQYESKSIGLDVVSMACADLVACGWSISDAWSVCVRKGYTWDAKELRRVQKELYESAEFKVRVDATKNRLSPSVVSVTDESFREATSRDSLIRALLSSRASMEIGSKEYIDATMKIADLSNAKKEESKTDEQLVHFHLPLKCSMCSIRKIYIEKGYKL